MEAHRLLLFTPRSANLVQECIEALIAVAEKELLPVDADWLRKLHRHVSDKDEDSGGDDVIKPIKGNTRDYVFAVLFKRLRSPCLVIRNAASELEYELKAVEECMDLDQSLFLEDCGTRSKLADDAVDASNCDE